MKVRFLQDYRGYLTDEVFFTAGSEADLPNGSDLIEAGRAEAAVEEPAPKEEPKEEPKPAAKKRGRPKKKASK